MTRDKQLKEIRPVINAESITYEPLENFQNNTLRQVLKLQNNILLSVCIDFLENRHKNFTTRDQTVKVSLIYEALKTEISLKKLLYGVIIGHFTEEELKFYLQNKTEINKRLTAFIFKRIKDQL